MFEPLLCRTPCIIVNVMLMKRNLKIKLRNFIQGNTVFNLTLCCCNFWEKVTECNVNKTLQYYLDWVKSRLVGLKVKQRLLVLSFVCSRNENTGSFTGWWNIMGSVSPAWPQHHSLTSIISYNLWWHTTYFSVVTDYFSFFRAELFWHPDVASDMWETQK